MAIIEENSRTSKYRKRYKYLVDESSDYRNHVTEIVENLSPRRGKYLSSSNYDNFQQAGQKKHQKIINGSGGQALKVLAGGMQGGLTSPSRPWFSLGLQDEELAEYNPVRQWLHMVRNAMLTVFARSNFYGAIHYVYWELGAFGTSSMLMEEDLQTIIRCRPFTIGEYVLALNENYQPCTLLRQFSQSAEQMRKKFGKGKNKLDGLPKSVVSALETNRPDNRFEVQHCIEPNESWDKSKADFRGKKYKSIYYPVSEEEDLILRESGYESIPFIAPRWEVNGVNTYGDSPAMDALGDIKMLQRMEEKKLMALDKQVNPVMNGSIALKNQGATMIAGGVNWVDMQQGNQGFQPAYQVNPNLQQMAVEIDRVERRIRGFFFNDLFLSVLQADKDMTAFEIAKRHEEKLMLLGPVIERQNNETVEPCIDRLFNIMLNLGLLPPPPKELQGMPLRVEFTSLLAQAQQMVVTAPIQQLVGFTAQVAQAKIAADQAGIRKVDWDETIDQFAGALGTPPACTLSDDVVEEMEKADAAKMQAQQMMAAAEPISKAVNNMGNTPMQGGATTALDALLGAAGSPPSQ